MDLRSQPRAVSTTAVGWWRISAGCGVAGVLLYAYALRVVAGNGGALDFFGYFTNITSLLTSLTFIAVGIATIRRDALGTCLCTARAVATTCLILVGVVYNVLVPGTGSAPVWVSVVLHGIFPLAAALDWLVIGDREPQLWRHLWVVLPYPLTWLAVTLYRGVTDGWVPYGFLLPQRGTASILLHVTGLLCLLVAAGIVVWAASRTRGAWRPVRVTADDESSSPTR